jgi:hypothetical protein
VAMVMKVLLSWTTAMPWTLGGLCTHVFGRGGESGSVGRGNLVPPCGGGGGEGTALPSGR